MPIQGGRMTGLTKSAVLPAHIGHPALVSDQYPRIPQAYTQIHLTNPSPMVGHMYADKHGSFMGGQGLYESGEGLYGSGDGLYESGDDLYASSSGGNLFKKIKKGFNKTFTPKLGKDITSNLVHKVLPAVVSGTIGSATTAVTGNPALGIAVGATAGHEAGKAAGDKLGEATGYGLKPKRLVKGSAAAKAWGKKMRALRMQGSEGVAIPPPPSRSVITDPSLLGSGLKKQGRLVKGSAAAKAWGEKMRELRNK